MVSFTYSWQSGRPHSQKNSHSNPSVIESCAASRMWTFTSVSASVLNARFMSMASRETSKGSSGMRAWSCATGRRLSTIEGGVCALAQLVKIGYEGFVHQVPIDAFGNVEQHFNNCRKAHEVTTLGRIAVQDMSPTRA